MKVIFSRKGFNSEDGGMPSPILPDGTMLSLPVPSDGDIVRFQDLKYGNLTYSDIIAQLRPNSKLQGSTECHLDPDLRKYVIDRVDGWCPSFGQVNASLSHLFNQGVGVGDLFLFFGWFRKTEWHNGQLRFIGPSSGFHAIYGFLKVDEVIMSNEDVPEWLMGHPHTLPVRKRLGDQNAIFVGKDGGSLRFSEDLVLTKKGARVSIWDLPSFFRSIPISYHANAWKEDGFHSVAKGQEFVFTPTEEALEWIDGVISYKEE